MRSDAGGDVRGRALHGQRSMDHLHNAIEVRVDLRIPEPQRPKSGPTQDGVAHSVVISLNNIVGMLAAVDLDDEAMLEADKVEIKSQQRRLPAEMVSFLAQGAKVKPKARFLQR